MKLTLLLLPLLLTGCITKGGGGGGSGQSMAMLKKELNTQNQLLKKLLDKDTNVYMDGNKVGTQLALSNPRMQ